MPKRISKRRKTGQHVKYRSKRTLKSHGSKGRVK